MVALGAAALRLAVGLIQPVACGVGAPQLRSCSVFQALLPRSGPGVVKRGLPGGEGGHASLPEGPGLLGFVEAGRPPELRVPGAAPLRRLPSAVLVFEMSSPHQGLRGAQRGIGLGEREIQPRVAALCREFGLSSRMVQKRGLDPKFVGRGLLLVLGTQGKHCAGTNNRVRQGVLRDVVHLGGLGQALLLHLFQLLLREAVAEDWGDYFLGIRLEALAPGDIIFLGKLEASPVGQRNVNGGVPSLGEAVSLLVALANVLLVGVFPKARGMDGVAAHSGAALLSFAELPPQGDEDGGKDDEQAQGDARDGHYVVCFLVLSWLDRRWGGRLDSWNKEHTRLSAELHCHQHLGILGWILQSKTN